MQPLLGYVEWRKFEGAINRAKASCQNSGFEVTDHFVDTAKMVQIGSNTDRHISDYILTRYACYLIAQNGAK